jgi:hypothetical protein
MPRSKHVEGDDNKMFKARTTKLPVAVRIWREYLLTSGQLLYFEVKELTVSIKLHHHKTNHTLSVDVLLL